MGVGVSAPGERGPRPIRVLMVIRLFYPWLGGTQRQAHVLARELIDLGVPVQIVTGWWFRGTPQRDVIDGIRVFRNHTLWEAFGIRGARKFGGYLYILTLLWFLWRRRATYDVIHVHGLSYHTFAAALAGRWLRRPTIVKLANSGEASDIDKMRRGQHLALSRFMLPTALSCDRFVALNPAVVEELASAGVPPDRIVRIPNGVEVEPTSRDSYELHDPARLLFVGRLHAQKGVDTLLRAFRQLRDARSAPLRLELVGDGPLREELMTLAVGLGISADVHFAGNRDDVPRSLGEADVFVLPSRAEGLSNALLEAMASGLPVVVSRIPGNVDVIRDQMDGLLVDVDDPAALATAIERLLADADLRGRLGRSARRTALETYALGEVARRYEELYASVLAMPARPMTRRGRRTLIRPSRRRGR